MEKKTVFLIHNGQTIVNQVKEICANELPDYNIINIIDESLVRDLIKYRGVEPHMVRRIVRYALSAQDSGAAAIIMTCSSLAETVDVFSQIVDIPCFKIDEPMYSFIVKNYKNIGLIGTLPSVIGPGERQLRKQAVLNDKKIEITTRLCEQAFKEFISGNKELHDKIIFDTAKDIAKSVDVIVLAQGSMAAIASQIEEMTGKPAISCLKIGIQTISDQLKKIHIGE